MPIILLIAQIVLGIVQCAGFAEAAETWWHIPGFFGGALAILILFFGGPIGGLIVSGVAFFAFTGIAYWAWWQAALVCFPYVALAFGFAAVSGSATAFQWWANRRNR